MGEPNTLSVAEQELQKRQLSGLQMLDSAINPPFPKVGGFVEARQAPHGYSEFTVFVEHSPDPKTEQKLRDALAYVGADSHVIYHNSQSAEVPIGSLGGYLVCVRTADDVQKIKSAISTHKQEFSEGRPVGS